MQKLSDIAFAILISPAFLRVVLVNWLQQRDYGKSTYTTCGICGRWGEVNITRFGIFKTEWTCHDCHIKYAPLIP